MAEAIPIQHDPVDAQGHTMKPHSAKAKGRRLQQYVRDQIIEVLGLSADDVFSRSMGSCGTDVFCSPTGRATFPFAAECKNSETLSIYKAWDQALANAQKEELEPLVVYKKNGRDPLAIVDFNMFLRLVATLTFAKVPNG